MFKQIRTLISEDVSLEGEAVEMDETYVGGRRRNGGKRGRGDKSKTCVVGVVERTGKGRVVAMPVTDASKQTLSGVAKEYVLPTLSERQTCHQSNPRLSKSIMSLSTRLCIAARLVSTSLPQTHFGSRKAI